MASYVLLRACSELQISIINSEIHNSAEVHFKSGLLHEMQIWQNSLKEQKNLKCLTWLSGAYWTSSSDILFQQFSPIKVQFKESSSKETSLQRDKKLAEESLQSPDVMGVGGWGMGQEVRSNICSSPSYNLVFSFWSNHGPAEHNCTAIKLSVIFN